MGRHIEADTPLGKIMRGFDVKIYQVTGKIGMSETAFRKRLYGHIEMSPDEKEKIAKALGEITGQDITPEMLDNPTGE